MILGHAADEILWLAAAIAVAGVATGIFAGLFHKKESALATIAQANRWTHPQNRMDGEDRRRG